MMDLWGTLLMGMALGLVLSTILAAGAMGMNTTDPVFRKRCINGVLEGIVLFGVGLVMWLAQVGLIF